MKKKIAAVILALLMISVAYAATRSLVPRADGEGGLGTSSKNWSDAYIDTIFTDVLTFTDSNASPDAVGELLYDNTVVGVDDGWFCWYDDDEIKYLVDTNALPTDSEDDYHLAYDKDTDKMYWKADADSGGATAWDDITNPDAADEIDFASYITELNVVDFRIGDGGSNYVKFDGAGALTFVGTGDIDLPDDSVDDADINWAGLTDLAAGGVLTGDCVDESHIADNGIDSEHYNDGSIDLVHLASAVYAKDLVTTAPITGAADNIFVGADSDVTVALTLLKDIVTTAPLTGAENDVLPGADADLTLALDFTAAWDFSGATVTLPSRTANDDRYFAFNAWNPNALYDTDTQLCIEPNLPANITITEVTITLDADPTTELDWDLKWADAFIGLGNAALVVAIDTTSGTTYINSGFDDATVVAGKCLYIEFAADPDSNIKQAMVKIKYDYD